ncbi:MAG: hypothetical protein E8D45_06375 [Nitrospira sp.]|nr:MAG: hypothetical protein E8D45_06375 [Nitrospira sp.]
MKSVTPSNSFPKVLRIGTAQSSLRYRKVPQRYAVHGPLPPSLNVDIELVFEDGAITICRGRPPSPANLPAPLRVTPLYAADPHGPAAVPTGQVFIRFKPEINAESRRRMVADQGYAMVQIPSYAPHTAWVQASNGDIATSLINAERLMQLPDVEHVAPQLLTPRRSRSATENALALE